MIQLEKTMNKEPVEAEKIKSNMTYTIYCLKEIFIVAEI